MSSAERCLYCSFILLVLAGAMWLWPGGNPITRVLMFALAQFLLSAFYAWAASRRG